VITQAVATMKPTGVLMGAEERLGSAPVDRDSSSAEFDRLEGISRCLLEIDVARNRGDGSNADVRGAESHDESDGVIRSRVRIDQEAARHSSAFPQ